MIHLFHQSRFVKNKIRLKHKKKIVHFKNLHTQYTRLYF